MGGIHSWEETLDHAIEQFGETPRDSLAELVARHYEHNPEAVRRIIDETASAYREGTIRSPWGIVKSRLEKLAEAKPKAAAATVGAKAFERAAQWMRAAGLHYDRWSEVHDELFGERGTLRQQPELEAKMHALYDELRPHGERLEQEAQQRADRYRQQRAVSSTKPKPAVDVEQTLGEAA